MVLLDDKTAIITLKQNRICIPFSKTINRGIFQSVRDFARSKIKKLSSMFSKEFMKQFNENPNISPVITRDNLLELFTNNPKSITKWFSLIHDPETRFKSFHWEKEIIMPSLIDGDENFERFVFKKYDKDGIQFSGFKRKDMDIWYTPDLMGDESLMSKLKTHMHTFETTKQIVEKIKFLTKAASVTLSGGYLIHASDLMQDY